MNAVDATPGMTVTFRGQRYSVADEANLYQGHIALATVGTKGTQMHAHESEVEPVVKMIFGEGDEIEVDASQVITSEPRNWGDRFPKALAEAMAEVEKAEDDLAAAYRRVTRIESEMAGYQSMTNRIKSSPLTLDDLIAERERMGKLTGNDLMGRYLAVLDAIENMEQA